MCFAVVCLLLLGFSLSFQCLNESSRMVVFAVLALGGSRFVCVWLWQLRGCGVSLTAVQALHANGTANNMYGLCARLYARNSAAFRSSKSLEAHLPNCIPT